MKYKSGYINILGYPNVGKSTLMNSLLDREISIASNKSQTTRHKILGIINDNEYQMIFCDTPGIIIPKNRIEKIMMKYVRQSLEESDILIYLIDIYKYKYDLFIQYINNNYNKPIILIINKIDILSIIQVNKILLHVKYIKNVKKILQISALKKINLTQLLKIIKQLLPNHPPYYNANHLTNKSEYFFITEIVRKHIFLLFHQEIPYSTHVNLMHIEKNTLYNKIIFQLLLTRYSQIRIITGYNNITINKLKLKCAKELQFFYQKQIMIQFTFKINKKWNNDYSKLKNIGYI
jgi:GTP-binding protein Era